MKIAQNRNFPILMILGIITLAITQISSHYFQINDSVNGFLMGFSFSLMILGLLQFVKKRRSGRK